MTLYFVRFRSAENDWRWHCIMGDEPGRPHFYLDEASAEKAVQEYRDLSQYDYHGNWQAQVVPIQLP